VLSWRPIFSILVLTMLTAPAVAAPDEDILKLSGSPYGETTIRNILRMSSGVPFDESYNGKDDLTRFNITRYKQDSIAALRELTMREVEQGTRFHYASSETVNLVVVLKAVTGTPLTEYLTPRLWQPIGAEADANWTRYADGTVVGSGNFNAILRDYGRLGILLAMTAKPAASRSSRRIICSTRPIGIASPRRSSRTRPRPISVMAISSGFPARSADLLCSASTASRSLSIRN